MIIIHSEAFYVHNINNIIKIHEIYTIIKWHVGSLTYNSCDTTWHGIRIHFWLLSVCQSNAKYKISGIFVYTSTLVCVIRVRLHYTTTVIFVNTYFRDLTLHKMIFNVERSVFLLSNFHMMRIRILFKYITFHPFLTLSLRNIYQSDSIEYKTNVLKIVVICWKISC